MSAQTTAPYPVHVEARLDSPSRWLWLVKWLLVIPHAIVLAFLWFAFACTTVIAFFAILFTGRYPRAIFDFNVGVLRWSWRVAYYTYSALGTDHYPPFTLSEVPDYPAALDVEYPERLSRGLVLVKWWLLAIPHYIVVALLVGGTWFVTSSGIRVGSGIIGILVLVAAVTLAFTGRYPQPLYDLILGFNRWALRVAAYAGLMTDVYPPFRLDLGGGEGPSTLTVPRATGEPADPAAVNRWTAGRIVSLTLGALLAIVSLAPVSAGVVGLVVDRTQRDADGFVHTDMEAFASSGYALTSQGADLEIERPALRFVRGIVGDARVQVESLSTKPVFVGMALESDAERYLRDVERAIVSDPFRSSRYRTVAGSAPDGKPGSQDFWTESAAGTGLLTLDTPIDAGSWTLVVMNADGSRGVSADISFGATAPNLGLFAGIAVGAGAFLLLVGVGLMLLAIVRRPARPTGAER